MRHYSEHIIYDECALCTTTGNSTGIDIPYPKKVTSLLFKLPAAVIKVHSS